MARSVMSLLESFIMETNLLPGLVAENVCRERQIEEPRRFIIWAEQRVAYLYYRNRQFHEQMESSKSREWLRVWVNHWLDAFLLRVGG